MKTKQAVSGNRRLVAFGGNLIFGGKVQTHYDSRGAGTLPDPEAVKLGLPEWHPVFPPSPKDWHDEDQMRKVTIEQEIADD